MKSLGSCGAFERTRRFFSDLTADVAGVVYKTEPTTPHQIGGVRLSKAKGAHKSSAPIAVAIRTAKSSKCWKVGQPKKGLSTQVYREK